MPEINNAFYDDLGHRWFEDDGHAIALLTCASVSAVCTNGEVGPGGAYYIISRALGPEFGGSIGVLFYVSQATGVAFYLIGLAETVLDKFKQGS